MGAVRSIDSLDRNHVTAYPTQLRDAAFECWAGEAGRNLTRVTSLIQDDPAWRLAAGLRPGEPGPTKQTVSRWAQDDDWENRWLGVLSTALPQTIAASAVTLVHSAKAASEALSEMVSSDRQLNHSDRIRAEQCRFILTMVHGQNLSDAARKVTNPTAINVDAELAEIEQIPDLVEQARRLNELEMRMLDGGKKV